MVLFILSGIINLKSQEKSKKQKTSVLNEFHASLTKKPKAAHTCYLRSLYPLSMFFQDLELKEVASKFLWPMEPPVWATLFLTWHRNYLRSLISTAIIVLAS